MTKEKRNLTRRVIFRDRLLHKIDLGLLQLNLVKDRYINKEDYEGLRRIPYSFEKY